MDLKAQWEKHTVRFTDSLISGGDSFEVLALSSRQECHHGSGLGVPSMLAFVVAAAFALFLSWRVLGLWKWDRLLAFVFALSLADWLLGLRRLRLTRHVLLLLRLWNLNGLVA